MKKAISLFLSLATVLGTVSFGACTTTTGGNNNISSDDKTINVRLYKAGYGDTFLYEFKEKFEEVKTLMAEVSRCRDTIRQYEAEIARIVKEATAHEKLQKVVRMEAANAKKAFDQLKVEYEEESQSKKAELDEQRARAKALVDSVDPALLEEYNTIKKRISPPVARLTYGQCSGCNTSLPSAVLSKIKNGSLVECETCGRMIIQ